MVAAQVLGRRGGLPWPGGPVWPFATGIILIAAGIALAVPTCGAWWPWRSWAGRAWRSASAPRKGS